MPVPGPHSATITADRGPQFACPSATYCQLLTDYQYLTRLSGVTAKTVVAPPWDTDPHDSEGLGSIACERIGSCVALGSASAGPWDSPDGYREELVNGTWTPEDGTDATGRIACNSERCVEIGTQDAGVDRGVLDDRAAGGSWVARPLTTPWQGPGDNGFYIGMDAVACPPSGPCYVLGHAQPSYRDPAQSLFFSWNGRSWRGAPIAEPAGATPGSAHLDDVLSCPALRTCVALGTYEDQASSEKRTFAEAYVDGTLSAMPVPKTSGPASSRLFVDDLSCASGTDCAGVVSWFGSGLLLHQALLRYHAGVWSSHVVSPSGATVGSSPYVYAAACSSATRCFAVGRFFKGTGGGLVNSPALWTWHAAGDWTVRLLPRPEGLARDASGELTTITCPGATRCYVGGSYDGTASYGIGTLG